MQQSILSDLNGESSGPGDEDISGSCPLFGPYNASFAGDNTDLDQSAHSLSLGAALMQASLAPYGELDNGGFMVSGFFGGVVAGGGDNGEAATLMGLFINGGSLGPDVNSALFGDNSTPGKDILNSSAFQDFASKFQTDFMNFLNGTSTKFNGNEDLSRLAPNLTGDTYLHTIMGGYQNLQANVSISDDHVTFQYTFTDHSGAGIGDAGSLLPGLASMYFEEHNYGTSSQYTPFVWSISVSTVVPR